MSDRRHLIVRLGVVAIWLGGAVMLIGAEEAPTSEASANRKLSQRVSELIRADLPHYVPPSFLEEEAGAGEAVGVMKDETLFLPTMIVREVRKAPPTSTDWLTGRGRLDFALKRFPGTKIGNLFGLNNPWATARLAEDIEAERHGIMKELGRSVLVGDTPEDRQTRELLKAALMYSGRPAPK